MHPPGDMLGHPLGDVLGYPVLGHPLGVISQVRGIYDVSDCGALSEANNVVREGKTRTRGTSQVLYKIPGVRVYVRVMVWVRGRI